MITFTFNRKTIEARDGDTVASALYRAGQRIFSRSFKYHRPRGLLCCAGKCPNCLMNVDGQPNVRTCITPVRQGMRVRHQNAFPSLEQDSLAIAQRFDFLLPVGWYYKTFTHPAAWRAAVPWIRKAAGLGDAPVPGIAAPDYEHSYLHTGVAVIGGGPAGLQAALEAARAGEQVTLIDDQPEFGGHLRYQEPARAGDLTAQFASLPNVRLLRRCYCFGLYEGMLLGVLEPQPHPGAVERLTHLRAQRVIVATGAYEVPLLFENNDLPGVLLSTAAQRLVRLHGIAPGTRAVVIARDREGDATAACLREAGVEVLDTVSPENVVAAVGRDGVTGLRTSGRDFSCDLVVVCGPRVPDDGLLAQAAPGSRVTAVGDVTTAASAPGPISFSKRTFVCVCEDVTAKDLRNGIAEGFDHIETLKRYTTTTMGPCQGRMCQLQAINICSRQMNRSMAETGTTTSRPPNPSVTLGALAGARHHPVRLTPMHYEHDALGAVWLDMGEWKRPRFYRTAESSDEQQCIQGEYRAVRERVGLIDVSTLGKLDLKGIDTGRLLDKVYTNRFSDLRPGRVRYSVICDEAGIMLDDGTISCLASDHYFITTTTGNLDFVEQWLTWWLAGTGWDAHITNVTGGLAAVNVAGPKARDVLGKLTDCDLGTKAFPYMANREAQVAGIPALLLRIGFVGETGWEIHYPAEFGEDLWKALLDAGKDFGIQPFAVEAQRLLRLEKRHVIVGVDTDALTSPFEADMAWTAKLDKEDFIGKDALRRAAGQQSKEKLVGFIMQADDVPEDGAAIVVNGRPAGRVTSCRYSPTNGKAVGLAWVPTEKAREGEEIDVRVNGGTARARIMLEAFYDPEGARLRM